MLSRAELLSTSLLSDGSSGTEPARDGLQVDGPSRGRVKDLQQPLVVRAVREDI